MIIKKQALSTSGNSERLVMEISDDGVEFFIYDKIESVIADRDYYFPNEQLALEFAESEFSVVPNDWTPCV